MDSKVDAIKNCPSPKNITELRSFLGMVNYLEKFIPFLHGKCAPLHRLTGTRTPWKWSDAEERTFQEIKSLISKEDTVVPYDRNKSIVIAADASENGLGAVICQRDENGNERPIAYGSRTLNDAEKHYASIDREAAALVFAVTKFHQYVYGKKFILVTDHKPLVRIFGCKRDLPKVTNNRLVRWALSLGSYDYDIEYRSGKENMIADFLSRMPLEGQPVHKEEQIKILNCNEDDILISRDRLKKESKKDPILRKIIQWVSTTWPQETTLEEIRPYFKRKDEISVEEGVVVWGGRIIIPSALQHETLDHLHQGHPGISAMKGLGRFYVWWPNFDKDVEEYVKSCVSCQEFRDQDYEVPLYPWNIPDKVWDRVHLDFAGPIDGVYWLVGIDAHSRWVEVEVMKSITSKNLISRLTEWFSRYGYPKMIVSDNGAQFTSEVFIVSRELNCFDDSGRKMASPSIGRITTLQFISCTNYTALKDVRGKRLAVIYNNRVLQLDQTEILDQHQFRTVCFGGLIIFINTNEGYYGHDDGHCSSEERNVEHRYLSMLTAKDCVSGCLLK
ncbi:unnamed protein product [Nesidiocoris tenuis]|uniref:RNA-directed DNA polymerase n=1 Tax=Nesidiocoris tenuis TaxID=355587 RepID=A0A6H5GA72_9HEMI|nr:unnamed protein product [Nesidiocoris tenuis]